MKPQIDRKRHILKTITWRIVGTIDTMLIGWLISGDPTVGLSIGGLELLTKTILYYFHERAWYRSDWGVNRKEKNEKKIKISANIFGSSINVTYICTQVNY